MKPASADSKPKAVFFTACNIDHAQMREQEQLWAEKEGVAALDYGVLGSIDSRMKQSFREGVGPRNQAPVLCRLLPQSLLPIASTQCRRYFF